ncbi:flagellar FlbD family protein [Pseudarthrobacter sp. BIM B-2242]|uniref:flagellar FlbD family protein n=1 Tax=Pseudarthrobacter sp. BIM B-2242 TaxID=2772401 RepID=UPI00168B8E3B|nr:flagellar FlbD family protein [Pseudarthrobacter sp. BIM B-2242]QOD05752.1 flagellar FlbD family protein [Pseudarthrobacter sp. BIM B-2242]
MIDVTRLDRRAVSPTYSINPDLIERIDENPDTTLHMADGATHIVAESRAEINDRIARYRAYVISLAREMYAAPTPGAPALSVVRPADDRRGAPGHTNSRK